MYARRTPRKAGVSYMRKLRVLFISLSHHPNINPTIPIVHTLVRRGHQVTYVASERFARRLSEVGAEVVVGPDFDAGKLLGGRWDPEAFDQNRIFQMTLRIADQCERIYKNSTPDLIIRDRDALAGRILTHRWGVPAIQTSPHFAHPEGDFLSDHPDDVAFFQDVLKKAPVGAEFLRSHGVPYTGSGLFHREGLNIYLFPKAIQPKADLLDESCFHAGRLAGEQHYFGNWRRTDSGKRPLVLIANSTTYLQRGEFFKMCMDALSGLSWHAILSIGEHGDAKTLGTLPPHVEVVQNTSHVQILRYATLVIGLGGIISIAEAAYHGVPTIALSCGYPENEWEQRQFQPLGTVIHLPKSEMNAENLRGAVVRASTDTALQQRVKALQHTVRREPGAEETVNRIEEYLESRLQ